jgi:RHS repeat-associated protein
VIVNPRYATQARERAPETAKAAFCDEVSGLRYYNPTEGRWLSRDPIAEVGGTNLYGYVGNNPIELIDPVGCSPFDQYFKVVDSIEKIRTGSGFGVWGPSIEIRDQLVVL